MSKLKSTLENSNDHSKKSCGIGGCVAKDVQVTMKDGSLKRMDALEIGDKIIDGFGGSIRICDIASGKEEYLLAFITDTGKKVRVTMEHILFLDNDEKPARFINIEDKIKTVDGFEMVVEIDQNHYNDTVYNLFFEPSSTFVANGIVVGDLAKQDKHQNDDQRF